MTFCHAPWTNIDISPPGKITPCCKFQSQDYQDQFNIQTHTIDQYKNSIFLKQIKQEFTDGKWPKGCDRCRIEEENHIPSKRQLDWQRWEQYYQVYDLLQHDFITASIAFGNTCNLKCITCNPHVSSLWGKEAKDLFGQHVHHHKFYKKDFVESFVASAPDVIHLDIAGGEPFISGVSEQKKLLQHFIDTGKSQAISLHYTTNATLFPDDEWWKIWGHFKNIDIQLSIDGIDQRYEYIRYPGKWTVLDANTDRYLEKKRTMTNLELSVSHTVSAYNIFYLDEFFAWCYTKSLPRPWLGRVHTPAHMRPEIWPQKAKEFIMQKLLQSQNTDVQTWASALGTRDESQYYEQFRAAVKQHDAYRGTSFDQVFPEMSQYL
jgi:hypothetical protein